MKQLWHVFINHFLSVYWSLEQNCVKMFFKLSFDLKYKELQSTQETRHISDRKNNTSNERRGSFSLLTYESETGAFLCLSLGLLLEH